MVPDINIWAVLLATVSSMVVGMVFYTPKVFGNYWMKLVGHDEESMAKANPVAPIVATVFLSALTAWVLAGAGFIAWKFYGGSFLVSVLITALILWAGFTAARFTVHDLFDRRPWQLTVLNAGHELITISLMGLIIGLMPI